MAIEEHSRVKIISKAQHPLVHPASEIGYANPAAPGGTSMGAALDYLFAVLYPTEKPSVANVAALPAGGNALNDYRVVLDDGDGRAAAYRWEQREGEAVASWHKVADYDWSSDGVISGFYQKTLDMYVAKWGYDDLDGSGSPLTGVNAGQHVYGGKTSGKNLTFHANSGDGVGAATGYVQFADNARPTVHDTYDFGTTAIRWHQVWTTLLSAGTLTLGSGSIADSSHAISFGDNALTTTGAVSAASHIASTFAVGTPGFTFTGDLTTGLYQPATSQVGVGVTGANVATFKATGLEIIPGSSVAPSLRFSDTTTGLYRPGLNQWGLATAGVSRLTVDAAGFGLYSATLMAWDTAQSRVGIGRADPQTDFHVYKAGSLKARLEGVNSTAANAPTFQFYRARAAGANLASSDDVAFIDQWGMIGGGYAWLSGIQSRYRGDGTTQFADLIFATANGGTPAERMRIRYDGNLGINVSDPTSKLHVSGGAAIDNLGFLTNTISTSNTDGNLTFAPNGAGLVKSSASFLATADNTKDLGASATRWGTLYLGTAIGDGTNTVPIATLMSLRAINTGVGTGYSIFWDGTKWVASAPDTEITHSTLSGLTTGDAGHTQFAMLAGRSGGQALYGSALASEDLTLSSTSHATKGTLWWGSNFKPLVDATYDIGDSSHQVKDAYIAGQLFGARFANYTTVGRPAASASFPGRQYWDTTTNDLMVDIGGTWRKVSAERYVNQDAAGWVSGATTAVTYTVDGTVTPANGQVSDARNCVWALKDNTNAYKQILADITMTQTTVTVTVGIALAAGTYTLVGIG